ncbi:hypothetical protein B0181_05125 [Moraxella caviae]|uniref:Exodeoxyribonuclease V gamma chain n=1 Tax=Moraxella caviae TaxID=34060 RepID=A0A1T0A414_9GAMM|nr:exodeoxyribonuclease V subunit gamma [Moraxella caviae]OOR90041.1 hypothetical protein B0181_05125 [Moraxella caviae]STZ14642.1 Exodeoxyribonuclease V gamma chain [Moraxella caviae]VEW13338.1 Exodeoxyribonuclease V gamma chain [Moraxella caviae]
MFHIIQSNNTDVLVERLLAFYRKDWAHDGEQNTGFANIFSPFVVIVPSMVLGDWLTKTVASKEKISTLFTSQFWGQYQWQMIKKVLDLDAQFHANSPKYDPAHAPDGTLEVPEVAMLSASVMRWRIFGHLAQVLSLGANANFEASKQALAEILADDTHKLHLLIKPLYDKASDSVPEHRLWQACDELARVYVRYLTQRPEWLQAWTTGAPLPMSVEAMIAQKDKFTDDFAPSDEHATPEWLVGHYVALETLLRHLWQTLFADAYEYREALEHRFWQVLEGGRGKDLQHAALQALPKSIHLFTVQQIPTVELMFLKRLSLQLDVHLYHFNPSKLFWADIVDKRWLMTQQIIRPESVYLKDAGHTLLSRLGKESRETFAMLADMSGGAYYYEEELNNSEQEDSLQNGSAQSNSTQNTDAIADLITKWQVEWQDHFIKHNTHTNHSLLQQIKDDILMLQEGRASATINAQIFDELKHKTRPKTPLSLDTNRTRLPSLAIHACHSLKRQLELARRMIARYLNETPERHLSDVVVLLPDVAAAQEVIRAVFPEGRGMDGLYLPAKITGTSDKSIDELMAAITGFYQLLGAPLARFGCDEFFEWLMIPALHESFGLSFDDVMRAKDLLDKAGFKRGFDEAHLAKSLHAKDTDYRYTFSYALDRLVLGLLTPCDGAPNDLLYPLTWQGGEFAEASLPLDDVTPADSAIIAALSKIHAGLSDLQNDFTKTDRAQTWLDKIEQDVINRYFSPLKDTTAMRAIFEAKNAMMANLRANQNYQRTKHEQNQVLDINSSHRTDDIWLSLQFVLESLAQAVSQQAISAEPSGVITFARFGAVRSIPFGLVIMLEMNLAAFPRQDKSVRLDLMRAGLKRRGDRYNEDDDNGAFLDALLCAKEHCLIFYQGVANDGITRLLPASPVGELLEFLKNDGDWHTADTAVQADDLIEQHAIHRAISDIMPTLIERYLVSEHTASDFERAAFYETNAYQNDGVQAADDLPDNKLQTDNLQKSLDLQELKTAAQTRMLQAVAQYQARQRQNLPPAPLWQQVRALLDSPSDTPVKPVIALPDEQTIHQIAHTLQAAASAQHSVHDLQKMLDTLEMTLPTHCEIDDIVRAVKSLAVQFLRGKLRLPKQADTAENEQNEPLSLDGLAHWQLNDALLQAVAMGALDDLPLANTQIASQENASDTASETTGKIASTKNSIASDNAKNSASKNASLQAFAFGNLLPAGVMRHKALAMAVDELTSDLQNFATRLNALDGTAKIASVAHDKFSSLISPTQETRLRLLVGDTPVSVMGRVPASMDSTKHSAKLWLSLSPSSTRAEHLLRFWLMHLYWQAVRQTSQTDVETGAGTSIWQFKKDGGSVAELTNTVRFAPVEYERANAELAMWLIFAQICKQVPIALTPQTALQIAQHDGGENFDYQSDAQIKKWANVSFGMPVFDNCAHHPTWQTLLGDTDPIVALQAVSPLAKILYQSLLDCISSLDDDLAE